MEKLFLNRIVENTSLNSQGFVLYTVMEKYLKSKSSVAIDLTGSSAMSSSFFNSSFGALIEKYGYPTFKEYVRFVNVSKNQAQLLRLYFDAYRDYTHH